MAKEKWKPPVVKIPEVLTEGKDKGKEPVKIRDQKLKDLDLNIILNHMAQQEGFYLDTSRAFRNKNPMNLKSYKGQKDVKLDKDGFIIFKTEEEGRKAALRQLQLEADRGLTLGEAIYKLVPPSDNNPTEEYLSFVESNYVKNPTKKYKVRKTASTKEDEVRKTASTKEDILKFQESQKRPLAGREKTLLGLRPPKDIQRVMDTVSSGQKKYLELEAQKGDAIAALQEVDLNMPIAGDMNIPGRQLGIGLATRPIESDKLQPLTPAGALGEQQAQPMQPPSQVPFENKSPIELSTRSMITGSALPGLQEQFGISPKDQMDLEMQRRLQQQFGGAEPDISESSVYRAGVTTPTTSAANLLFGTQPIYKTPDVQSQKTEAQTRAIEFQEALKARQANQPTGVTRHPYSPGDALTEEQRLFQPYFDQPLDRPPTVGSGEGLGNFGLLGGWKPPGTPEQVPTSESLHYYPFSTTKDKVLPSLGFTPGQQDVTLGDSGFARALTPDSLTNRELRTPVTPEEQPGMLSRIGSGAISALRGLSSGLDKLGGALAQPDIGSAVMAFGGAMDPTGFAGRLADRMIPIYEARQERELKLTAAMQQDPLTFNARDEVLMRQFVALHPELSEILKGVTTIRQLSSMDIFLKLTPKEQDLWIRALSGDSTAFKEIMTMGTDVDFTGQ